MNGWGLMNNWHGMNWGEGVGWNGQLYDAGNEFTWKTGGWNAYAYKYDGGGGTAFAPTLTKNATNMVQTLTYSGERIGSVFMENAIDLTNYSKIKITFSGTQPSSQYTEITLILTTTKGASYPINGALNLLAGYTTSNSGTLEFDISALNGLYYVALAQDITVTGTSTLTTTKIWLE